MNPFLCPALLLFASSALGAPSGPLALNENVQVAQRTTATTTRAQPAGSQKSGQTPSESQALVAAPASGLSINSAQFKRLFGPGVYIMDALADLNVGVIKGHSYVASHRFRATSSGKPLSLRVYWPAGPGYSAGNGGTISVRIVPDDGSNENLPAINVSPLATGTYAPGLILGRHVLSSFNDEVRLGSLAPLVAGQLYHVVYENIDSEPARNFIGVNNVVTVERNGRPARWLDPTDWASLFGFRSAGTKGPYVWKDATRTPNSGLYYAPILQINLDGGKTIGAVDIETGNVEGSRQWSLNSGQSIRERFTPKETRTISGLSVHASTTTGGEIEWSFRDADKVLASGRLNEPGPNYGSQFNVDLTNGVFKWYDIELPSTIALKAGASYDLQFDPVGSSQWRFADEYNGSDKGFSVSFAESQAQVLVSGKWINANHRSQKSQGPASNWRVVLHLAPVR